MTDIKSLKLPDRAKIPLFRQFAPGFLAADIHLTGHDNFVRPAVERRPAELGFGDEMAEIDELAFVLGDKIVPSSENLAALARKKLFAGKNF